MTQITLENVSTSQSGKSLVIKSGGKTYYAKMDSGLKDKSGATIEAELTDSEYQGKPMTWINKWGMVHGAAPGNGTAPAGADNVTPWWAAFVSNTVAHAIAAGRIDSAGQIAGWAQEAYKAIHGLKGNDSNIPF